jgi:two-component system chemotaxis response regulator CheB
MAHRRIVVVGGSAGAIEAARTLLPDIPSALDASYFMVIHIADEPVAGRGLAEVLARASSVPCAFAVDAEPILPRRIYIAPPGQHLTLDDKRVRVVDGPRENGFRPAIDPLFRTAAYHHGNSVVGVVLSGARDDGAAGLATIHNTAVAPSCRHRTIARSPACPRARSC